MSSKRLKILVMILVALALGSILLAACSRPGIAGSNPGGGGTTGTSTPSAAGGGGGGCATGTVHMGPSNFLQSCANVSKGSKLMLVDDVQVLHIITNGMWDSSGTPHPANEPGAPVVPNVTISGGSAQIGPFNTAGTYHIFCTVHVGMNLIVHVM
jgi:plastocyanin